MDTEAKYRNDAELVVEMVGDEDGGPPYMVVNNDVPVDGRVSFLYRDDGNPSGRPDGKWIAATFPFRSVDKDGHPWFAFPDEPKFSRQPVWKWTNPDEDPHESLTLSPSLGLGEDLYFHCWVRDGRIDWV